MYLGMDLSVRPVMECEASEAVELMREATEGAFANSEDLFMLNKELNTCNIKSFIEVLGNEVVYGLYDNSKLIGVGSYRASTVSVIDIEIGLLYIKPSHQHRGCGDLLFRFLIEEASRYAMNAIYLSSISSAVGFYEKYGFKAIGSIWGYPIMIRAVK